MMKNLQTILAAFILTLSVQSVSGQVVLIVQEPAGLAGGYNFTYSSSNGWGADMDTVAITAMAAFAVDGTAADSLGCEAIVNRNEIEGKIAVVYRGECNFSLKALNVQDSGAVAIIIINNIPGAPVGMGGGTNSADVVIPVAMITQADGELLRNSILAGEVEIFLGNNTGLFASNVGAYLPHIGMANSQSIPSTLVQAGSGYEVPIGTWVHNYGSTEAINVAVTAVIDRDGTEVYNETSSSENIPLEDSLFFALNTFAENGYESGLYTITYTIVPENADEYPSDNTVSTSFWINDEGIYSKSKVDPENGPVGGNGVRPAEGTEYQWCIVLMEQQFASEMQVTGMTFSTLTNDIDLTGQAVQLAVYEWNDPITTSVTFDDLNEVTDNEFYDYAADLQGEFVTHNFAEPLEMLDDQKYLACATIFIDDMFLTVDASLDYNATYDSYPNEVFFPLNDIDGGTWYAAGFGSDNTPALLLNMELANGIADDINAMEVTPFPNPTVDMINIPFGTALDGNVTLDIHSVDGKLVRSEALQLQNTNQLRVDVSGLSSGLHTFSLTFEDNSRTSFRVVVSR